MKRIFAFWGFLFFLPCFLSNAFSQNSETITISTDSIPFIENLKKKGYDLESELKTPLREFLGTTKPNTLAKGSEEYELGMKYIENQKNYIPAKEKGQKYIEQLLEKESFDREHKMEDVLYYFLPTWRI